MMSEPVSASIRWAIKRFKTVRDHLEPEVEIGFAQLDDRLEVQGIKMGLRLC